jgi:hypothetical protein
MNVVEIAAQLAAVDASVASPGELAVALADVARLKAWLAAFELAALARFKERAAADPAAGDPLLSFAQATRSSLRDATRRAEQAEVAALVPGLSSALRDGETTAAHLQTLADAVMRLPAGQRELVGSFETQLVAAARTASPEHFARTARATLARLNRETLGERIRRQRAASFVRTWTDRTSGMTVIHGEFDSITGLHLVGALESAIEDRYRGRVSDARLDTETSRDHLRARALAALVRDGRRHGRRRGKRVGTEFVLFAPGPSHGDEPVRSVRSVGATGYGTHAAMRADVVGDGDADRAGRAGGAAMVRPGSGARPP